MIDASAVGRKMAGENLKVDQLMPSCGWEYKTVFPHIRDCESQRYTARIAVRILTDFILPIFYFFHAAWSGHLLEYVWNPTLRQSRFTCGAKSSQGERVTVKKSVEMNICKKGKKIPAASSPEARG
jgi:hypothetical protein